MKHINYLMAALAVGTCAIGAAAQTTQKFTAAKHNEYGLVYSLPVTHVRITVEAERTVCKAGPFYKYAKKYLGVDDVVTADSETWTLKSVSMDSYGVPDQSNRYLMQFKSGSSPFLMMTEDGLPLAINEENVALPIREKKAADVPESRLDNNNFAKSLPGELLTSESTAKRAELAAQMIYKLRESRTNYATGEADQMPPDGAALKLILDHLDEQEADLMALFCGTRSKGTAVKTFDYVPMDEVSKEVVFRLSDANGIVDKNDLGGAPATLSLKIDARGQLPKDEKGNEKKLPKGAVMYRIPGSATLTISYEGEKVCSKTFDVAQFGIDFGLDPAIFTDKKRPSFVKFYPETGAIKELGLLPEQSDK